jgi:hypothetical protein
VLQRRSNAVVFEAAPPGLRACLKNVASAGRRRRTVATKLSGTILNSRRLAPKGRAPRMGLTTAVYRGVMRILSRRATQLWQAQTVLKHAVKFYPDAPELAPLGADSAPKSRSFLARNRGAKYFAYYEQIQPVRLWGRHPLPNRGR